MFGELIEPGQVWIHNKNKKRYFVTEILNESNAVYDDNNPPIIRYMDGQGGRYGRLLINWHVSFTLTGKL